MFQSKRSEAFVAFLRANKGQEVVLIDNVMYPNEKGQPQRPMSGGTLTDVFDDGYVIRTTNGEIVYEFGTHYGIMFPSKIATVPSGSRLVT